MLQQLAYPDFQLDGLCFPKPCPQKHPLGWAYSVLLKFTQNGKKLQALLSYTVCFRSAEKSIVELRFGLAAWNESTI